MADQSDVYELLSQLCRNLSKDHEGSVQPQLVKKCRSRAYEILLHRASETTHFPPPEGSAVSELFSCYFVLKQNGQSVAEQRAAESLLTCAQNIRDLFCKQNHEFEYALRFLLALKDEIPRTFSTESFQPFTFGVLDKLLPRLPREDDGSPLPYQYYPQHMFRLPFTFSRLDLRPKRKISLYTEYTVESFKSQSNKRQTRSLATVSGRELKAFELPSSLTSQITSGVSIYSNISFADYPRLLAPRDLVIPKPQIVMQESDSTLEVEEMFRAEQGRVCDDHRSIDIWELASSVSKDVPTDIWEIASKLPYEEERSLIVSSAREMALWKDIHNARINHLHIVPEKLFIRNLMYLTIGIESQSFKWNPEQNAFTLHSGLLLEGLSKESVQGYVASILNIGTCYRRLYNFAFNYSAQYYGEGYVFEAARNVIRRFLLSYRLKATEIYSSCFLGGRSSHSLSQGSRLPTLLQILHHLEPLRCEIETIASIYKIIDNDGVSQLPRGAGLMTYLYNEISLVTHAQTAVTMFRCLYNICTVYFKFIERFIFQGELEDRHEEFFIRKDAQCAHSRTKRYWDRGFHIADISCVPQFLRSLAKHILLCGKSFRLLKLCNPSDPLVLLISTDHPSVRCCTDFEQMERQQKVLDVYRTRCLFVSGDPVTFDQIMLRKEAEKKAFTEMATVKQAETLEKIVAERKRLAQLIIAEKQHNLRVLETAIAETEAKKRSRKQSVIKSVSNNKKLSDETDCLTIDEENNKMLEYYSKLNQEVEKRKVHTEWKIKRLQLDSERMQLLSTEERNLKREKLELQHVKHGDGSCSNSIYSNESAIATNERNYEDISDVVMKDAVDCDDDNVLNKATIDSKTDVLQMSSETNALDTEGNLINAKLSENDNVVNSDLTNCEYTNTCLEALTNKRKVETHKCNEVDNENNINISVDIYNTDSFVRFIDNENNFSEIKLEDDAHIEAKRNKNRVLGTYKDNITSFCSLPLRKYESEDNFTNIAHEEAWHNRVKVLGTEEDNHQLKCNKNELFELKNDNITSFYSLPLIKHHAKDNFTSIAHEDAWHNREKVLGTEEENYQLMCTKNKLVCEDSGNITAFGSLPHIKHQSGDNFTNVAQEEAWRNRVKVLGTEEENYQLTCTKNMLISKESGNITAFGSLPHIKRQSEDNFTNVAHEEAWRNRVKILGTEEENYQLSCKSQNVELIGDKEKCMSEGQINRQKALCAFNDPEIVVHSISSVNLTDAQKEGLSNKLKVLGTQYQLDVKPTPRVPLNVAQEEAAKNKRKILESEYGIGIAATADINRRSMLKLDLKKPEARIQDKMLLGITPTTGGVTPGNFYSQLELETPTTAEVPFGDPPTTEMSPGDQPSSIFNESKNFSGRHISSDGFKFPSVILEEENPETTNSDIKISVDESPSKVLNSPGNEQFERIKSSIWSLDDQSYNFDGFDPFEIKGASLDSKSYLSSRMALDTKKSYYSNPADIFMEAQKKPYPDIFGGYNKLEDETECSLENSNIATLTACFQRSVLLPLFYQLEMVNNSILTYYLVNLDMYEHLRSLKDYFFLMDGEFSSTICENLFLKLVHTLNPEDLLNYATLHSILDKALGSSIAHVNKYTENLSFMITELPLGFQHSSPDVLQCLSLSYAVSWPMNIILSSEILSRYAKCFQFLLKMRRISWTLGQDFETLKLSAKLSGNSRALITSPQYNSVQLYRHVMASLVRALDNYIVTTCIQTSWNEFEGDLKKARTLDDLQQCHAAYIRKVLFRCLLNKRSAPVMKLLNDIFTVILRFSHVLRTRSWIWSKSDGTYMNPCFAQLQELFHLFEKLTRHLHKTVTKLMECGYQPHLAELIIMVNLNGYYDPIPKSPNATLDSTL